MSYLVGYFDVLVIPLLEVETYNIFLFSKQLFPEMPLIQQKSDVILSNNGYVSFFFC